MAIIKPASTGLSLVLSLEQQGGLEVTKSLSVANVDVNATADALFNTASALASLLAYPMVMIRHNARGIITE